MKKNITSYSLIIGALLFSTFSCKKEANQNVYSSLLTEQQLQADSLSLELLKDSSLQQKEQEVYTKLLADSVSQTPEGKVAAKLAAQELVQISVEYALAKTPKSPKFLWVFHAPRTYNGTELRGSRIAFDNPDNVYRIAFVDNTSDYEIRVHHNAEAPIQESFDLSDADNTFSGNQIAFLEGKDIQKDSTGDFVVIITSRDTTGANVIRLTKPLAAILYRNTLSDWSKQRPTQVEIKRLNGNNATPSNAEYIETAKRYIDYYTGFLLHFSQKFLHTQTVNQLGKPFTRQGNWGFAAGAYYHIEKDEAWVIRLNPKGAKYVGFQLADPWEVSLDYIHHNGSLNINQAVTDPDGNITYVLTGTDPGVPNWLDTRDVPNGTLFIRWQFLPDSIQKIDDAIIWQKIVKKSDLNNALAAETQKVTPEQRKQLLKDRATSYENRILR
jgi:hypothetical protein